MKGYTPFDLVQPFQWITVDMQWAALYNEFKRYKQIKEKIANVHLRGKLRQSEWILENSSYKFYDILEIIRNEWGYKGILTMEPNGLVSGELNRLIFALSTLK